MDSHSKIQHRHATEKTLPEVTWSDFAAGHTHWEKCCGLQQCSVSWMHTGNGGGPDLSFNLRSQRQMQPEDFK